jgi:hypothetical protein
VRTVLDLWRGELPLARAFWLWGVLGGGVVNLFATLAALALVTARVPAWVAALAFAAPIPWNVGLLLGVWRSAARPGVGADAAWMTRAAMLAWVALLCLL